MSGILSSREYIQRRHEADLANSYPRALNLNRLGAIMARRLGDRASADLALRTVDNAETFRDALHRLFKRYSHREGAAPRVLIFGAYGNGNLGDAYQALAVRQLLMSALNLSSETIFACSLLDVADYAFPSNQKLEPHCIHDHEFLETFDCLIVGGGGLLAHPHEPLQHDEWAKKLKVPVLLLAIGASAEQFKASRHLAEDAYWVSGRDDKSVQSLKEGGGEVSHLPDPILAVSDIEALTCYDESRAEPSLVPAQENTREKTILWVVKYPSNDHDLALLRAAAQLARDRVGGTHRFVAIEPALDHVLTSFIDNEPIDLISSASELLSAMARASVVLSMRYHGAIFGILANRPVVGMSQIKIKTLFEEYEFEGQFITDPNDLARAIQETRTRKVDHRERRNRLVGRFTAGLQFGTDGIIPLHPCRTQDCPRIAATETDR